MYPLTHSQRRIWYVENMVPGSSIHNIGGLIKIYGPVDFVRLEQSIHQFIMQNDAIRMRMTESNGRIEQYIAEYCPRTLPYIDFTNEACEIDVDTWVREEFSKPLPIDGELLFDFALVKISEMESAYLTKVHHIISDGWSFQLMTSQINEIYKNLSNGKEVDYQRPSYIDYMEQERKYINSARFLKNQQFWKQKFSDVKDVDLHMTASRTTGQRRSFYLDTEVSTSLQRFAKEQSISLNTLFIAAMLLYLHKSKQQDLIIIGTPVLNRTGVKEKNMFGMFTSTMPLVATIEEELSLSSFIHYVNHELIQCYFHQKYPYNLLVQDLELHKRGIDQLFQVSVNYYNTKFDRQFGPGWGMRQVEVHNGNQLYPLQLIVTEWSEDGGLELHFDYKIGDYSDTKIEDIYTRLLYITEQLVSQAETKICDLQLFRSEERMSLLYEWNQTAQPYPREQTIVQLFEEQVERMPDRIALSDKERTLSYAQLNARANQLARHLLKRRLKPQDIVVVMMKHSIEMVVSIWAIIKAGGVYLPIDPEYPHERIDYIFKNSGALMLLTEGEQWRSLSYQGTTILVDAEHNCTEVTHNLRARSKADDLVYIIYTSGSTGNPKGTMIEHRGLTNYVWWANKTYIRDSDDVFALYSSIAFDLTVTSIFTPLLSGNRIEIYDDNGSEFILERIIRENKVTVLKLTPAHLTLMKDIDTSGSKLQRFIVGGDDLKSILAADIVERFPQAIEIYNEYGPTETVVGCMICQYDPCIDRGTSVPIGQPIDNMYIYLLDRYLEPVPTGSVGEIYISGDGVARGYLQRPDLTKARFLDNPFMPGQRMYRTGDLAMRQDDGHIVYLGRVDHQVKIKGYRIEIGEIENQLLAIEEMDEVIVIDRLDEDGHPYLVAYYVAKVEITSLTIRMKLANVLPSYMLPSYFVQLDQLPLTPNGKIDRKLLPAVESGNTPLHDRQMTVVEELLSDIFADVLQIEKVDIYQNFYRMGGDSIKAIQIASKVNAHGYKVKVQDILSYPVIHELATLVEINKTSRADQGKCEGVVQPVPIFSWFTNRNWKNSHFFVQSVLLRLSYKLTNEQVEEALYQLITHHDTLRLYYDAESALLTYRSIERAEITVNDCDLSGLMLEERARTLKQRAQEVKESIRMDRGLLIKATLFDMGEQGQRLLLTAHHFIVDGVSWRILLEDLALLLQSVWKEQSVTLPLKTHSLQKWAQAMTIYSSEHAPEQLSYWQSVLDETEATLPVDQAVEREQQPKIELIARELMIEDTQKLLGAANDAFHTQTNDLLLAALAMAVRDITGQRSVSIELEGHGREDIDPEMDVSRTIGWFTSMYPVNLQICEDEIARIIKSVKEQLRAIPRKGIDYGILTYLSRQLIGCTHDLIRFNYMGEMDNSLPNSIIEISTEDTGVDVCPSNELTCLMDIVAIVIGKQLHLRITYDSAHFQPSEIERFTKVYMEQLSEMIRFCVEQKENDFTPSDFDTVHVSQDELDVLFS
ncbi:non-ribosomal peptide synthetase [Paenibacillus arenosi]|uniref:non-ribosomal peptide synthetase n=1 Tax=Paenibacillus arenosi TaxID=2774142 RepID=UPI001CDD31C5|nr:non-ribosomal peptide synthetase [Paenibacillus arenosi]